MAESDEEQSRIQQVVADQRIDEMVAADADA